MCCLVVCLDSVGEVPILMKFRTLHSATFPMDFEIDVPRVVS